jgi:hypothetical protein
MQFTCVVNSVGPTSGDWESTFLDPRDDPRSHGPIIVLNLSDLNGAFKSHAFVVASIDGPWEINSSVLAVALAAINTGSQVMAEVDWPPPTINIEGSGLTALPAYCHSLWLNAQSGLAVVVANILSALANQANTVANNIGH